MSRLRTFYEGNDPADTFLRKAAADEGLTYHQWCKRYGVVDEAALKKRERHEINAPMDRLGVPHGGDPPKYETADWGPDPRALTIDNVLEGERRSRRPR